MTYYVGNNPQDVLDGFIKRYFYGMRRNEDGELFLIRIDQLQGQENVAVINDIGVSANNFLDFEEGIDYLDGVDQDHNIVYANLRYPQIRWDGRSLVYYIDPTDGQFIMRISEGYDYPENISGPGY
jgi:hypothetical protein|tara:strand:+ start:140 stop:517 length:378 start_codon:yes stop_codon:yes gene_type:complete